MNPADIQLPKEPKPLRLLIADDDLITQAIIKNIVKKLDWEYDIVGNGLEVLEKIKHSVYDVILMDIEMPELDGYETTLQLRALGTSTAQIPIIGITAYTAEAQLKKCLEVGMDDYIVKPINTAELRIKIKLVLNRVDKDILLKEDKINKPLIDIQNLYTACGDTVTVKNIIGLFIAQTPGNIQQLTEFITASDWEGLKKLCHKMKASYALIGLLKIKTCLQQMEEDCENNVINVSKFESYMVIIQELNVKAVNELKKYLMKG